MTSNQLHARTQWSKAYRAARCLALGSLYFAFPRAFADIALSARDFTRTEPVLTARRFAVLGYYRRGFKRI